MPERCPYSPDRNKCARLTGLADFVDDSDICANPEGNKKCGSVEAYYLLKCLSEGFEALDKQFPIVAEFIVDTTKDSNNTDKDVVEKLEVGLRLPIRYLDQIADGIIEVNQADFILAILVSGRTEVLDELKNGLIEPQFLRKRYKLDIFNGNIEDFLGEITSFDYYGGYLSQTGRQIVDESYLDILNNSSLPFDQRF